MRASFREQMRGSKIRNLSELSYKTKIPLRELQSLIHGPLKDKDWRLLDKLKDFFGCQINHLFTENAIWQFDGNSHNPISGVVYFVRNRETGLVKIGYTTDLLTRLQGLELEHKAGMHLIHYIATYDAAGLEKVFHSLMKDKRVEGEWFGLSMEDLEEIKNA